MTGMNFYKRYMGDFARDTAHLTLIQRGAYNELLDYYYSSEKPLPADKSSLYRIAKAMNATERNAVDAIADQFFPVNGDGFRHNTRADRELADAHAYADAQAMRAHKRWHKPDGMQGQCPIDASHSHSHSQLKERKALSGAARRDDALQVLQFLNEKTGRSYQPTTVNLSLIIARLNEGASVQDCKSVVAKKIREWVGDAKMAQYLRPATLFNREKFSQYWGELVEPEPEKKVAL
jgi:uncharacterized phage protein (TIGR02220 family)